MLGQRVAAESLYRVVLGELHNPQQISLQVRPTELRFAGMILQVRAETVAAQDALKDGSQQTDQHFAAAGGRHRVDHVPCRHESPQEAFSAIGPPAVSSTFNTGSSFNCRSSSWHGAATAWLASSQHFCVLPKLISMPSTCPSSASTTRRGIRQTTVRYAISAASCGPKCPKACSGTVARVLSPHSGQTTR